MRVEKKLAQSGIVLTDNPDITKSYVTLIHDKYHVYVSGIQAHCPSHLFYDGNIIGRQLSLEWLKVCARRSISNQLSMLKRIVEDLDTIDHIIKVVYYINGIGTKEDWRQITNETTGILRDAFGQAGDCEICTIAPVPLPPGQPVQVDILVSLPASIFPGYPWMYEGVKSSG
ncbi:MULTISPECIES: hypothetical protein [Aneurinibacillus]|jgi:hypothetical protein|uniref:Uncharacterized protein n=1 Tax=Aneurinibacillus danicus TaxID=267746 RepID=A0A511V3E4_9BACL|nr:MULTISPECIES: hypothetical protein [Aneurinibacillus]GEN33424.1 hypothetical protein ADA01nite_08840 [Aneurinibacillus danicus]